ncbi:unnamed protein product [Polarella glacialis]|uniref:MYND-type domain-containing protein n=1 Tax=Polarella glacialis TaxID=89957 RepID=A0A813EH78_POLGL|nr:unnamed protein product [Polarella glacialis]CAE8737705.1 unnamed protein product [Polarella glacialis]
MTSQLTTVCCRRCGQDLPRTFFSKRVWKSHRANAGYMPICSACNSSAQVAPEVRTFAVESPHGSRTWTRAAEDGRAHGGSTGAVETVNIVQNTCDLCCKQSTKLFKCGRCRIKRYCSLECQTQDWTLGVHKQSCRKSCTRCGEPFSESTECHASHPLHMKTDLGSTHGEHRINKYRCEACGQKWSEIRNGWDKGVHPTDDDAVSFYGARWCFCGPHTLDTVSSCDTRMIKSDSVDLKFGTGLQSKIDALCRDAPSVKRLTITSSTEKDYYFEAGFTLAHRLLKLKCLHVIDVRMNKLTLSESLTPHLQELFLQNIGDECELEIALPSLRDIKIHYLETSTTTINKMLRMATGLVTFNTYKLIIDGELVFAGRELQTVKLHRSDCLSAVSIWAPQLLSLNLQACYAIQKVTILDEHEMKAQLPICSDVSRRIVVNLENASVPQRVIDYLLAHPRVSQVEGIDDDEEDWIDTLPPDHYMTHFPKSRLCTACMAVRNGDDCKSQ